MSDVLSNLKKLVMQLRDKKQGDPWIIDQTFQSLVPKTLEESYELADSIDQANFTEVRDELADLLFHVVLYAEIAEEQNFFNLAEIAEAAIDKQVRRRLNFTNPAKITAQEALLQWEKNKSKERQALQKDRSVLDGISNALPAIHRSCKLQLQAASVGFDWPDVSGVLQKLAEEINELKTELSAEKNPDKLTDELGDILFTCIALAKHVKVDPEIALRHANNKFDQRFRLMEKHCKSQGENLAELSLEELDQLWNKVKEI